MQTNNKLREALEALVDVIDKCDSGSPLWWHSGAKGVKPLKDAYAALAEPIKNCEVGTVEEQYKRFMNMCNSKDVRQCAECSMRGFTPGCSRDRCFARWLQMPYEEGVQNAEEKEKSC